MTIKLELVTVTNSQSLQVAPDFLLLPCLSQLLKTKFKEASGQGKTVPVLSASVLRAAHWLLTSQLSHLRKTCAQ